MSTDSLTSLLTATIESVNSQAKWLPQIRSSIVDLESTVQSKQATINSLNDLVANQRSTVEDYSVKLTRANNEIDLLQQKINELTSRLEEETAAKNSAISQIEPLKARLVDADRRCTRYAEMLQRAEDKEQQAVRELRDYMKQYIDKGSIEVNEPSVAVDEEEDLPTNDAIKARIRSVFSDN